MLRQGGIAFDYARADRSAKEARKAVGRTRVAAVLVPPATQGLDIVRSACGRREQDYEVQ